MAHAMVDGAKRVLKENLPGFKGAELSLNVKKEENSFGNGSSIVIIAETTTGCVLGGSGLGSPKEQAFSVGEKAAKELVGSVAMKGIFLSFRHLRPCQIGHIFQAFILAFF